jgi:hypothetical protein
MLLYFLLTAIIAGVSPQADSPSTSLCLEVQDETNSALPGAWIRVVDLSDLAARGRRAHSGRTGPEGKACLPVLPSKYQVEVGLMGYLNARFYPVTVYAGRNRNLRVVLPVGELTEGPSIPETVLTGKLSYNDEVLTAARVCLLDEKTRLVAACARADGLGNFLLLVTPAKYAVLVTDVYEKQYRGKVDADRPGRVAAVLELEPVR